MDFIFLTGDIESVCTYIFLMCSIVVAVLNAALSIEQGDNGEHGPPGPPGSPGQAVS